MTPRPATRLTITRPHLEAALRELVRRPGAVAWAAAGVNRTPSTLEVIAGELRALPTATVADGSSAAVAVALAVNGAPSPGQLEEQVRGLRPGSGLVAWLAIEHEPRSGRLSGAVVSARGVLPLDAVRIVGPGMPDVPCARPLDAAPDPRDEEARERWSRLIGALGELAWRRLRELRYAIVGVGRTGSLVTLSLARLGASQLALIDPDRLELHNVDAMDGVRPVDVGALKVDAVGAAASNLLPEAHGLTRLAESITTRRALHLAKAADVLIACVDDDGARLATAVLATLYARPLLDIGTGVLRRGAHRRMGADIRLVLPGDGCLLCLGGVADLDRALAVFRAGTPTAPARPAWHAERAGSLRSLNQIAAHLGLRLLEDLMAERVARSSWIHIDIDARGRPSLDVTPPRANTPCPLCAHGGRADAGAEAIEDLPRALARTRGGASDRGAGGPGDRDR